MTQRRTPRHVGPMRCGNNDTRPVVAMVVPATSKGLDGDLAASVRGTRWNAGPFHRHDAACSSSSSTLANNGGADNQRCRALRALMRLPVCTALLRSLYSTMEPHRFAYTVYLVVNEGDWLLSQVNIVQAMFEVAFDLFSTADAAELPLPRCQTMVRVEVVVVADNVVPSSALSALFNVGTLAAYADGASYMYLANDDLELLSTGWTSAFASALAKNRVAPNLGVAGAADVSDEVTPQIEFPFFHRRHVDIFHWCGAQPWIFQNWWEDNWFTDIYTPFQSVFYFKDILVSNYGGLGRAAGTTGSTDPRYTARGGRQVPWFYLSEVRAGRRYISTLLSLERGRVRGDNHHDDEAGASGGLDLEEQDALRYCPRLSDGGPPPMDQAARTPPGTLSLMPVLPHQDVLDPCEGPNAHGRPFDLNLLEDLDFEDGYPLYVPRAEIESRGREVTETESLQVQVQVQAQSQSQRRQATQGQGQGRLLDGGGGGGG
uniref:Uncharacterized protein n=1 Tax=Rhizochromulina marina TaxID=1034831 RepID=A0A7S2S1R1_9STRA|mmetsp:Transcript_23900/g.70066  ORF Transcript_23900/g.70066 Transcript_23900/m.70066 type:complete len:488 (+) Transcript_23900:336-1799(+)